MTESPIVVEHVDHSFGEGELRRQVLFDVSTEVRAGEIVILTGPSGSGKTTLLTLMGALRSAQSGSLRVLGHELNGAGERTLAEVRHRIGYVFQSHNLLDSLTAAQNVRMSLQLHDDLGESDLEAAAVRALETVGLGDRATSLPGELSGGQRQRVAIARALAANPRIVLADEPTASLDRETGRSVVELLEQLARRQGATVVLVTHDARILDVADRILALEDGRLSSLLRSVATETQRSMRALAQDIARGDLARRLEALDAEGFRALLDAVTAETRDFLDVIEAAQSGTFERMLQQVMTAVAAQLRRQFDGRDAGLFLLEEATGEFFGLAQCEHGADHEVRLAAEEAADEGAGRLTASIRDSQGRVFALLRVAGSVDRPFVAEDARRLEAFAEPLGLLLESWWRMSCACRAAGVGRIGASCCDGPSGTAPIVR